MRKNIFLLFSFYWSLAFSQKGQVAAGGDATGAGGSASYSIGQIDYIAPTGSGGNSNEGLQQPYELFVVSTSVNETENSVSVNVFPNPVSHSVNIHIKNSSFQNYSYKITDVSGKLISENKITEQKSVIPVSEFNSGTYFITISEGTTQIKTYKLIKY
ncbi:MAG TPA: T9SS type A sorting domain-containing protein [Bacteroidia bacterium]|jgi:hypothetical protein|nr:T9SS type A sorting domain-containing protein [Bacteroidia bacterium]